MKKTQAERAQSYFERNPQVTQLVGTSDGFLFERNQDALSHSITLENKELKKYNAPGAAKAETKTPTEDTRSEFLKLSVKKIQKQLPEMKDVDALTAYLEEEKALEDSRSTAIDAIAARIAELTPSK